jgi:hypothetical protein
LVVLDGYLVGDLAAVVQQPADGGTESAGPSENGGEENGPPIVHPVTLPREPGADTVLRLVRPT